MKVVAAYLLAVLGGNASPSADDLKNILASVGADAEEERLQLLLSEVKGKDITELIASGREKLASVPSGGAETKKEEKVEEKEESDDSLRLKPPSTASNLSMKYGWFVVSTEDFF
ncbi:hypothetical protein Goklo_018335 [Gossypium klotzschianum]|uniref:60S acidic ribosomal protein P2 n=1 Tax=Gossypium klotzschianum TaxID=34286 RepID=A0A7J8UKI7_9ROSI|nr:hypothetical protein [Gossypium klotzschianum]